MDHATPTSCVAAFCVAVMRHLIPDEFWGTGEEQIHNRDIFLINVKNFVLLRRFESMTLHEVAQGIKVSRANAQ
jgi:telomerase reverse transcriptase